MEYIIDTKGILLALNSNDPLDRVLEQLAGQACGLLNADASFLYRVDFDMRQVYIEMGALLSTELAVIKTLPLTAGLSLGMPELDAVMFSREPKIVAHTADCAVELAARRTELAKTVRAWCDGIHQTYLTVLFVPLFVRDTYYGNLGFCFKDSRVLLDHEVQLAIEFAGLAALALENARLRIQTERAAIMQERSRLARDLHDSVTQSIYSLTLLAEAARRLATSGDLPRVKSAITRLGEIGRQALKEMRLLVYELRPVALRRIGLVGAIRQRLETVERRAGVEAQLVVDEDLAISPVLEEQLYHIVLEALNNVLKHSDATRVHIRFQHEGTALSLEVTDNGRGFSPEVLDVSGGIGLVSMQERVEQLGGKFVLESTPGQGVCIQVTIDLVQAEERWKDI